MCPYSLVGNDCGWEWSPGGAHARVCVKGGGAWGGIVCVCVWGGGASKFDSMLESNPDIPSGQQRRAHSVHNHPNRAVGSSAAIIAPGVQPPGARIESTLHIRSMLTPCRHFPSGCPLCRRTTQLCPATAGTYHTDLSEGLLKAHCFAQCVSDSVATLAGVTRFHTNRCITKCACTRNMRCGGGNRLGVKSLLMTIPHMCSSSQHTIAES